MKTHRSAMFFLLAACLASAGCGSSSKTSTSTSTSGGTSVTTPTGPTAPPAPTVTKSAKRGIAYDLAAPADFAALSPGVSWWYNWSPTPNTSAPANYASAYAIDFYPMLWSGNFNATTVVAYLKANASIKYMLVLNEPNLLDQANMTPQEAAQLWPQYEAIAAQTGVKIVGPAMTWGTMAGYENPVTWLDAFIAAYQGTNGSRNPQIDYIAFHWYDYGLNDQLNALAKYQKPFWVTEFANWHSQIDGSQVVTLPEQQAQMTDMVATCEGRSDVFRYAWFTGRTNPDPHFTSLLGASGQLTALGATYISLPVNQPAP